MPDPGLDMAIVVPSRGRAHNMGTIGMVLPSAIICVDEREKEDYLRYVPEERLLLHPPFDGYAKVVNWLMDAIPNKILVICDDDMQGVRVRTGSKRFTSNSTDILTIIENSARVCQDLDLSTFCFSRVSQYSMKMLQRDDMPMKASGYLANVFGMMGTARHRKLEPHFAGRNAIDLTLRTLLEDRCIYQDTRFYFDCGAVFAGRGGNVGVITADQWSNSTKRLSKKWGRHISFNAAGIFKKFTKQVETMKILVRRRNTRAQT